jgi:hypothetical protein
MVKNFYQYCKKSHLLLMPLLVLLLLCGCSVLPTSKVDPTPTAKAQPAAATPTSIIPTSVSQPLSATATALSLPTIPTPSAGSQKTFASYVNKWEVHGSLLTINANQTGLELWNAGPCAQQMCNGNARVVFTVDPDDSIKGIVLSVTYTQWDGSAAPSNYQPTASDPKVGDTFQLQHSGAHLLYTTWFGAKSSLNSGNRYWCDAYAVKAAWSQCGA